MKGDYSDITDRLGKPLWWDEVGVPRYNAFTAKSLFSQSAREAVLLEIACQNCGEKFIVALAAKKIGKLRKKASQGSLEYGDPPAMGCCEIGATMNSIPLYLLQFWQKEKGEWTRKDTLEGPLQCSWFDNSTIQELVQSYKERSLQFARANQTHRFIAKLLLLEKSNKQ